MTVNLLSVAVATIAGWIFGSIWYVTLSKQWMQAAGLSEEDIKGPSGKPSPMPYVISVFAEFVMAYMLAIVFLHTSDGDVTLANALFAAAMLWLGFVLTTQMINHRYSMKPWSLTIIDGGHWLGVLLIQAAVLAIMGLQ